MSCEVKDPKIKLFGKTIDLPESFAAAEAAEVGGPARSCDALGEGCSGKDPICSSNTLPEGSNLNGEAEEPESQKSLSDPKPDDAEDKNQAQLVTSEELKDATVAQLELKDSNVTPSVVEDPNAPSADAGAAQTSNTEDDQSGTSNSQEKTLKKPDKILPCPRCNSMDTKFCYFNNYNVNQPRHFCKNCQRYWTAGGTMRNVPVGAGRRKNKNAASQIRHLSTPGAAGMDIPDGMHHPAPNPNGTILAFTSDSPVCESMVSVLNIADNTIGNSSSIVSHKLSELGISVAHGGKEDGDDHSSESSVAAESSQVTDSMVGGIGFTGTSWPYHWNPVYWGSQASPPTLSPASFPLPFYPVAPPCWACPVPGLWNLVPWVTPPTQTASESPISANSGSNSPTLGKHSRDESILEAAHVEEDTRNESSSNKRLWVPKTLRIDDPEEAAKSSIWATLGIKNESVDSVGGGGTLFKAFRSHSKSDERTHVPDNSTLLKANPAALSRSLSFHENS